MNELDGYFMYRYVDETTGLPATWEEVSTGLGVENASPGWVNDELSPTTFQILPED